MRRLLIIVALLLAPAIASAQVKIVIDAGHGGTDPGGVGTGMQEKNVVLDVSKRFKALLEADTADTTGGGKWTALLTRSNDTFVSLAARSAYSNNQDADRFMSIHANAFGDASAHGTETFSYTSTGTSAQLRNLVQAEMLSAWGLTNRGNKTANFAVLRDTAAPAILHELAFITNASDAAKLGSPTERQKAAAAHLRGLQRSYNIPPYVPGAAPEGDTGAIAGRVVDAAGPIVGATVELAGGASVVTDVDGKFAIDAAPSGMNTLTASAEGYVTATVDVNVVAAAREDVEIVLVPTARSGDSPDDGDRDISAGCQSSHGTRGAALGLLVGLLALRRRRRA